MQNLKSKISRYMTIITVGIISVIIVVSFLVSMLSAQSNARKEAKYLLKQIEQLFEENQQDLSEVKEELFNDFSLLRINEGVDYLAIDAKTETVPIIIISASIIAVNFFIFGLCLLGYICRGR